MELISSPKVKPKGTGLEKVSPELQASRKSSPRPACALSLSGVESPTPGFQGGAAHADMASRPNTTPSARSHPRFPSILGAKTQGTVH